MIIDNFYIYDKKCNGTKGLVFIGEKIIVYRRDNVTKTFPLHLDLPGGGTEDNETPFDTFKREVKEEFDIDIVRDNIVYAAKYPSSLYPNQNAYFAVAKLDKSYEDKISFGDEGIEYMLLEPQEYLKRNDAWPIFQDRTKDYLESTSQS